LRLYAGVIRFFIIVVLIHVAMFWLVGALAGRSAREAPTANTLRLAGSAIQVRTLDPVAVGDTASHRICAQIYEGLVAYNQETLAVDPCLAERWEISPDGKLYTFYLRKGVHFHDDPCFPGGKGREMTAEDVVYSFRRVCDPIALGTGFWLVDGRVVGATEYNQARQAFLEKHPNFWELGDEEGQGKGVTGFRALSRYVFQIELVRPFAPFLKVLAMSYFFVTPPEAVRQYGPTNNPPGRDTFFKHPVGTGPFTLERWEPDVEIILRANPGYWGRDKQGRKLPYIDGAYMVSRRDPHTAFMEFEEGNSDIAGVPDQDWDRVMNPDKTLKEPYASRFVMETAPTLTTFYYGFNMTKEPFKGNKALRQAFNYAIDRAAIIDKIYRGVGFPAYGPIPPGLPGYDPNNRRYEYDVAKAKKLLAEAGYPEGKGLDEIVLHVSGAADAPDRTSVAVMEQLRLINVKVRLKSQPWPLHLESIDRGEAVFFRLGWVADYPDAENFLALFITRNHNPGPNSTLYSNPEYDRLYDEAMLEPVEAKRAVLYRQMADIIVDDCPWLFTTYDETISLRQPWVTNYPLNALGIAYFKNIILTRGADGAAAGGRG